MIHIELKDVTVSSCERRYFTYEQTNLAVTRSRVFAEESNLI